MKFSVLISVYIKEKPEFLKKALDSIYNQTLRPDEIVLVKDGILTRELEDVISIERKKFENQNIDFVCVQLQKNMGLGIALQKGLEKCKYEYIARMDSDDIAVEDRFEKQADYMRQNSDLSVVGGYIDEFAKEGKIIRTKTMPLKHTELYKYGKYRNPLNHMTVFFRKKDVLAVGGYQPLKGLEDYYLWSRMLAKGYKIGNIDRVLVRARLGNFANRRGGLEYFLTYIKLRRIQNKIQYTNILEFIFGIIATASITLSPNRLRGALYKLLRKDRA